MLNYVILYGVHCTYMKTGLMLLCSVLVSQLRAEKSKVTVYLALANSFLSMRMQLSDLLAFRGGTK